MFVECKVKSVITIKLLWHFSVSFQNSKEKSFLHNFLECFIGCVFNILELNIWNCSHRSAAESPEEPDHEEQDDDHVDGEDDELSDAGSEGSVNGDEVEDHEHHHHRHGQTHRNWSRSFHESDNNDGRVVTYLSVSPLSCLVLSSEGVQVYLHPEGIILFIFLPRNWRHHPNKEAPRYKMILQWLRWWFTLHFHPLKIAGGAWSWLVF